MPTLYTNFSARDYTAVYEWLITILRQEVPEYTDMNYSDAGMALLRLISRATDSMSLYIDLAFAESFIHTAKFKQSIIDAARTVDLLPKMYNAAATIVTVTRKSTFLGTSPTGPDIFIPKYTQLSRRDGLSYVTLEDVSILGGETSEDVPVIQGEYVRMGLTLADFTKDINTGRYYINIGTGVAYNTTTFIENSISSWTEVESFWRSFTNDGHFVQEIYADLYNGVADSVFFTVGNGVQGRAVSEGSTYTLGFIRCSGLAGNCATGIIDTISDPYDPVVSVTNIIPATGGANVESIEDFRLRVPKIVRTQRRGVTSEDYDGLVLSVPGVKHCQCLDRTDVPYWPFEHAVIYVVPEGGGSMSDLLRAAVMRQLTKRGAHGSWEGRYLLFDALSDLVNINCSIGIEDGFDKNYVVSQVTSAINSVFSLDNIGIHSVLVLEMLHKAVMGVTGVAWVEFPGFKDVYSDFGHLPTLGNLSVTVKS